MEKISWADSITKTLGEEEYLTDNEKKEGQLDWSHLA